MSYLDLDLSIDRELENIMTKIDFSSPKLKLAMENAQKLDFKMRELDLLAGSVQFPKPPSTFPQFSQLPSEIRIQIWRHAYLADGPRIVEIETCEIDHNRGICFEPGHGSCGWVPQDRPQCRFRPLGSVNENARPNPAFDVVLGHRAKTEVHVHRKQSSPVSLLFSVNREAREELQKLGMLTFSSIRTKGPYASEPELEINTYLNFEVDTLAMRPEVVELFIRPNGYRGRMQRMKGLCGVKKLLLLHPTSVRPRRTTSSLQRILKEFPEVKELLISLGEVNRPVLIDQHGLYNKSGQGALKTRQVGADGHLLRSPQASWETTGNEDSQMSPYIVAPLSSFLRPPRPPFACDIGKFKAVSEQLMWMQQQYGAHRLEEFGFVAVQRKERRGIQWGENAHEDLDEDRLVERGARTKPYLENRRSNSMLGLWMNLGSKQDMMKCLGRKREKVEIGVESLWIKWKDMYDERR